MDYTPLLPTDVDDVAEDGAIAASAAAAADVQAALVKRVLPALSEQLIVKNEVWHTRRLGPCTHMSSHECTSTLMLTGQL